MKYFLLFLSLFLVRVTLAQDNETEPNDQFVEATPLSLPGQIQGAIAVAGDVDNYRVIAPGPGVLRVNLFGVPNDRSYRITVFTEEERRLQRDNTPSGQTSVVLEERVCAGGVYYVQVTDILTSRSDPKTYTLDVTLDTSDIFECNDRFDDATVVSLPTTLRAAIRAPADGQDDVDFFRFRVRRSGVLDVEVSGVDDDLRLETDLFDARETGLGRLRADAPGQPIDGAYAVCDSGIYFLRVQSFLNQSESPRLFTLRLSLDTTDIFECNDEAADAAGVAVCDTITGTLRPAGDEDYYAFSAAAGDSLTVTLSGGDDELRLEAELLDRLFNRVAFERAGQEGQGLRLAYTPAEDGDYVLAVRTFLSNDSSPNPYRLFIESSACATSSLATSAPRPVRLFPNPATSSVSVELPAAAGPIVRARVLELTGRVLHEAAVTSVGERVDVAVGTVAAGTYLLEVTDGSGQRYLGRLTKVE